MDPVQAVKSVFSKYATFQGRARRSEYWWFALFSLVASVVAAVLDNLLFNRAYGSYGVFGVIVTLGLIVPSLAVAWRRLHDTDRSGAWYFIGLIPLVGTIILLVFLCTDSKPQPNRFGPSPKQPEFGYSGAPGYPPVG